MRLCKRSIGEVTRQAFASHPHSSHTEQFIVDALRQAGALAVSYVAEQSGEVVGHLAISPVVISDGSLRWFGLGPVSVLPEFQRRGIGRALIEHGVRSLRERGAAGCVVYGNAQFYARFGFVRCRELVLPGLPQERFLALALGSAVACGDVTYHTAFAAQG